MTEFTEFHNLKNCTILDRENNQTWLEFKHGYPQVNITSFPAPRNELERINPPSLEEWTRLINSVMAMMMELIRTDVDYRKKNYWAKFRDREPELAQVILNKFAAFVKLGKERNWQLTYEEADDWGDNLRYDLVEAFARIGIDKQNLVNLVHGHSYITIHEVKAKYLGQEVFTILDEEESGDWFNFKRAIVRLGDHAHASPWQVELKLNFYKIVNLVKFKPPHEGPQDTAYARMGDRDQANFHSLIRALSEIALAVPVNHSALNHWLNDARAFTEMAMKEASIDEKKVIDFIIAREPQLATGGRVASTTYLGEVVRTALDDKKDWINFRAYILRQVPEEDVNKVHYTWQIDILMDFYKLVYLIKKDADSAGTTPRAPRWEKLSVVRKPKIVSLMKQFNKIAEVEPLNHDKLDGWRRNAKNEIRDALAKAGVIERELEEQIKSSQPMDAMAVAPASLSKLEPKKRNAPLNRSVLRSAAF